MMKLRLACAIALLVVNGGIAAAQMCPTGQTLCGQTHCAPSQNVCCAPVGHEELSCPAGEACTPDGNCVPARDGGAAPDGGSGACPNGGTNTVADCGGDSCGCSARCSTDKDCESACCTTAGLCAPACVCRAQGKLFLNCDTSGAGFGPLPKSGCAMSGRLDGKNGLGLVVGLAVLSLLGRRRSHAC